MRLHMAYAVLTRPVFELIAASASLQAADISFVVLPPTGTVVALMVEFPVKHAGGSPCSLRM